MLFFLMVLRHPSSPLFPYTTLFRSYALAARKRGVLFDVGHGAGSFLFRNAVPAIQQGFLHGGDCVAKEETDRKSTRLNSSHMSISYAVFCLKKKKNQNDTQTQHART